MLPLAGRHSETPGDIYDFICGWGMSLAIPACSELEARMLTTILQCPEQGPPPPQMPAVLWLRHSMQRVQRSRVLSLAYREKKIAHSQWNENNQTLFVPFMPLKQRKSLSEAGLQPSGHISGAPEVTRSHLSKLCHGKRNQED